MRRCEHLLPFSVLPVTAVYLFEQARYKYGHVEYLPLDTVPNRVRWLLFGDRIRTVEPFTAFLSEVVRLAAQKKDPLVFMTLAFYVAPGYSYQAYMKGSLDYTPAPVLPIETWGLAQNVVRGVLAHNEATREIVRRNPDVFFIDQEKRMPKEGKYFRDICHLSDEGCRRFVANVVESGVLDQVLAKS
jgi:hypothetical protein